MARSKKKPDPEKAADDLSSLLELAHKCNLPDNWFDGDIEDECKEEARAKAEEINAGVLLDKLEFLVDHGYQVDSLKAHIEEFANASEAQD